MTTTRAVWRLLLSLPLLGLLAPACLRLTEPDSFICSGAADCLADERCSNRGTCAPKGTCEESNDCDASATCQDGACVAAECYEEHTATCGAFACQYSTGRCLRACTTANECQDGNVCNDGACAPSPNLVNDKTCSQGAECASGVCCGPQGRKVCANTCGSSGSPCKAAGECTSGICCAISPLVHTCSVSACVPFDVGDVCVLPADCASGSCTNGVCAAAKCQADNECPAGYCASGSCETTRRADGAMCNADQWCDSGSCINKLCVGKAKPGAACSVDADCEATSVCCARPGVGAAPICSAHNAGCAGDIGESCDYSGDKACLKSSCFGDSFCSVTCTVDSDCRVSPWGTKNLCRKNYNGALICFPGCANDAQCSLNLDQYFSCTSGVCSGDYLSDDDVRLQ